MQRSLHSQKAAVTAYSFIVFEDQVFDAHYLTRSFRKNLIHKLRESPFNKNKQDLLPPFVELELYTHQMKELVSWLKDHQKDLPSQKGVLSKRIDYILFCLETSIRKTEETWGNKNDYLIRYSITTLNCIDNHFKGRLQQKRQNNPHKYSTKTATTNFEKFNNPQIVFWCLDTDGLDLNQTILNEAEFITVAPLQRFFKKKIGRLVWKEHIYHHPQKASSNIDFSDPKSLKSLSYTGTDHFLIMLTPNLEIVAFSLMNAKKSELRSLLDDTYENKDGIPTLGFDAFIGISRLSKSRNTGDLKLRASRYDDILDLLIESDSITYHWSADKIDQFLQMVESKNENSDYGGPFLSASVYLRKFKGRAGKSVFLLDEKQNSPCEDISDCLQLYKWTINLEKHPVRDDDDLVTKLRVWSDF